MEKIKRFITYYKPHKKLFILDMVCAVLVALIDLAFPMYTRFILNDMLPEIAKGNVVLRTFILIMIVALIVYILRSVFLYVINYWGHTLGVRMEADIRRDLFKHIQAMQFSFYDRQRTGKLMSRITSDLFEITELAHHGPEDILISGTTVIGAFICMFFVEWRLALSMLIVVPPAIIFLMKIRLNMRRTSIKVKESVASINADIESAISGARVAKAFNNEEHEIEKFEVGNRRFVVAKDSFYKYMGVFHSGLEFLTCLLNLIVIAVGGVLINAGTLDIVLLMTFTLYVSAMVTPIRKLMSFAEQYMLGMAGFSRFLEIMDEEPDIRNKENAIKLDKVKGNIDFHDVSFAYSTGSQRQILDHLNLSIPAGKKIALVGPSGGGKTTICHLIPRFYDIQSGSLTIDGHDVRDVTLQSLRHNVGIVQQDVFLFAGTVMENIRYGNIDASEEEIIQAAIRAHIHNEIMQMPNGYNTVVGERGILLSGGQKQRIAIARLFLKNPPILILDEATSALDTITEYDIQHSFDALSEGRTTIVIAHRLSTVKHADEIFVIDRNGIQENGTHDELMHKNGTYAQLYSMTLID